MADELKNRIKELEERIKDLEGSNTVYKKIFDKLPYGIQIFNNEGTSIKINEKQKEFFKNSNLKYDEGAFNVFQFPDTNNIGFDKIYRRIFDEDLVTHEFEYNNAKDEIHHYYETIFPVKNGGEKIDYIISIVNDKTKTKNIENKLRQAKEQFDMAMHATSDGLWDWNLETNDIYFSPGWKKMLGYEDHELENKFSVWEELTATNDVKRAWDLLIKHLNGEVDRFDVEFKMKHKDGSWVDIHSRANAYFDESGKANRVVGTHVNISYRKKIEEELRKNKALLFENEKIIKVGGWEYTVETKKMYWTDGLYEIHEMKKNDRIDHIAESLKCYLPEDREKIMQEFQNCVNKGIAYDSKYKFITHKNNQRWIRTRTSPVYENGKIVKVIGSVADITEIKETETKLKELNATKDKLFSIIAHDLRSPFNSILGFTELAINNVKSKEYENLEKHLGFVEKSARRSYNLLNNLLQWSRLQTGSIHYNPVKLELNSLLSDVTHLLEANIKEKRLNIDYNMPESFELVADRQMLETIIRNLVSNAIKYSHTDGRIKISALREEKNNKIQIKDYGIGINKKNAQKIFHTNGELIQKGTNGENGTGLGLVLCKDFIDKHCGEIWVESERNKGASFTFTIPIF